MKIKVIAIGNILMEDDGVAITVVEKIKEELVKKNCEVIIGETDLGYCISSIEDRDFVFFVDAVYLDKKPGEITVIPMDKYQYKKKYYTQHSYNVVDLIKLYFKEVKGYIIGIEIGEISFKLELSSKLERNIDMISENVLKEITSKIGEAGIIEGKFI